MDGAGCRRHRVAKRNAKTTNSPLGRTRIDQGHELGHSRRSPLAGVTKLGKLLGEVDGTYSRQPALFFADNLARPPMPLIPELPLR